MRKGSGVAKLVHTLISNLSDGLRLEYAQLCVGDAEALVAVAFLYNDDQETEEAMR